MDTRSLLFILAFIFSTIVHGQEPTWEWVAMAGGDVRDVFVLDNDDIVVCGAFTSAPLTLGGSTFPNAGATDAFVAQIGSNGQIQWVTAIGGNGADQATSITVSPDGSVWVAGTYTSSTFVVGGTTLSGIANEERGFIAKFNSSGLAETAFSIGDADDISLRDMTADPTGALVISGTFWDNSFPIGGTTLSGAGLVDGFVAKYDPNGVGLWARTIGGVDSDLVQGLDVDAMGNIYITGNFRSPVLSLGPVSLLNSSTNGSFFLMKLDPAGTALWGQSAGSGASGFSLDCTPDGQCAVCGVFSGSITFGPSTGNSEGGIDAFVALYDTNGVPQWGRVLGGAADDNAYDVVVRYSGDVLVTGWFVSNSMTIDGISFPSYAGTNSDGFVLSLSPDGTADWGKVIGSDTDQDTPDVISAGNSNSCYIAGSTNGSPCRFDDIQLNTGGEYTGFVARMGGLTGIADEAEERRLLVYPNPARSTQTVLVPASFLPGVYRVYDPLGSLIKEGPIKDQSFTLGIPDGLNGVFLLQVEGNGQRVHHRVIFE